MNLIDTMCSSHNGSTLFEVPTLCFRVKKYNFPSLAFLRDKLYDSYRKLQIMQIRMKLSSHY